VTGGEAEPGVTGRRWGIGLCVGAVVLGGLTVFTGYSRMSGVGERVGGFPAVAAGHEELVGFDEAGGKTAYYESTCFECGDGSGAIAPRLEITSEDGDDLEVGEYATDGTATASYTDGPFSYTRDDVEGEPEYTFRISEPGTYRVRVGPSDAPDAQMRFGPSVTRDRFWGAARIVGGVLAGVVLGVSGVIVFVVASVRRRRWRRRPSGGPWQAPGSPLGPGPPAPARQDPERAPDLSWPPGPGTEGGPPAAPRAASS
jgi:hypothetical protein